MLHSAHAFLVGAQQRKQKFHQIALQQLCRPARRSRKIERCAVFKIVRQLAQRVFGFGQKQRKNLFGSGLQGENFVIKKRKLEVECDFLADTTTVIARLDISITIGQIIALLVAWGLPIVWEFLKIINKRKGGAKA